mgnify:CR=1 FL=1
MSYKYPASKVSGFIPQQYASVIVELMNTRPEADHAQFIYLKKLLNTIVQIDSGADFIEAFTVLIKRLAVDRSISSAISLTVATGPMPSSTF